jgi:hypothetical protein
MTAAAQAAWGGTTKDFYDYRWYMDPPSSLPSGDDDDLADDLADFYGSENFMDIFCVVPFMGTLMMRGGYFDEEGTVHTTGLPGEMLVSMVFSDGSDIDEEENEGGAGGSTGGGGVWFNKRERFRNVFMGYTCWDMVTNFGFEKQPDGRILVYHHGEYFASKLPPISLLVKLVFTCHARWVAWATEHHLHHYAFRNETEVDEELERESREDMPLFLLKHYAWSDLVAALFNTGGGGKHQTPDTERRLRKPSFLILKSREAAAILAAEEATEATIEQAKAEQVKPTPEIDSATAQPKAPTTTVPIVEEDKKQKEKKVTIMDGPLPVQRPAIMRRITMDINFDRETSAELLQMTADAEDLDAADDFKDEESLTDRRNKEQSRFAKTTVLARKNSIGVKEGLQRSYTITRRMTTATKRHNTNNDKELNDDDQPKPKALTDDPRLMRRRETLGGDGGAAWEALRATNNPAAYKGAALAAQQRFIQRKATIRRASTILRQKEANKTSNTTTTLSEEEKKVLRRASLVGVNHPSAKIQQKE